MAAHEIWAGDVALGDFHCAMRTFESVPISVITIAGSDVEVEVFTPVLPSIQ